MNEVRWLMDDRLTQDIEIVCPISALRACSPSSSWLKIALEQRCQPIQFAFEIVRWRALLVIATFEGAFTPTEISYHLQGAFL